MPDYLEKLRPDRDLQCYFERPSAIAALSGAGPNGFVVSGCWRQQFDWAVVEWNRDNVFEHPAFRNLPDGDLSGLHLTYDETRLNCIPLDSNLPPTVAWPDLRIWAGENGAEALYTVPLIEHATPLEGESAAAAVFELQGAATQDDYVELAWLSEHHTYRMYGGDTLEVAAAAIAASVNAFSDSMAASAEGGRVTLTWKTPGANGNRIGVYGNVSGAGTESWSPAWQRLSGGTSPAHWRVDLDFGALKLAGIPTHLVRKMRWTWSADLQEAAFQRSEFQVAVTNWTVTGTNRRYRVAGSGSRRVEEDDAAVAYNGEWDEARGNFSGGAIRYTTEPGAAVTWNYAHPRAHTLYLGTRHGANCASVAISLDGVTLASLELGLVDDVLVRLKIADLAGGGAHTITVSHDGTAGSYFYFDFFEAAVPEEELPEFAVESTVTAATDWDTDHSMALAPERTAWIMNSLGLRGRANHYAGALWFYELEARGWTYASGIVEFAGTPEFGKITRLWLGPTLIEHTTLIGDTTASLARAFELEINAGSTGVWAEANGAALTIHARMPGRSGNDVALAAETNSGTLEARLSGDLLAGGEDGQWLTDLAAVPRVNRAARDWTRSYLAALHQYGIAGAVAFSMELQHGDPSVQAGIAQRYPNGEPCWLNTPALQTNFSPASLAFWSQVYRDMAAVMAQAGVQPFLQFGEVQWWYFPAPGSGMPFYDAYTQSRFQQEFGRAMPVFADAGADPALYPDETVFLSRLIGDFTDAVMAFVRQAYQDAIFEVLYPPDVNEPPLTRAVNLPAGHWTPESLACFKTENFTYTGDRNLDKARLSILLPLQLGFARSQSAHLVGTGSYTLPWQREAALARGESLESVVLFALDQFCLVGCRLPLFRALRRGMFLGK